MAEYQALYRKWRPIVFDDVVGQKHITDTLRHELNSGQVAHAYLFCGTRGTGKTSSAKIFSRAINCTNPQNGDPCNECSSCQGILDGSIMDVYEMDAASNNGVDNIRQIRDEVAYTPANVKYKVYIIDEVHMLSPGAFNALLKTLEEPPSHVIFILATTEPHKIPATILSRCQRFDFRRITIEHISARMKYITENSGINISDDALYLLAELADGSMRDGLSLLDQCSASCLGDLTYEKVIDSLGIVDKSVLFSMADSIAEDNPQDTLIALDGLISKGKEVLSFFEDFISHFRSLLLCKTVQNPSAVLDKSDEMIEKFKLQAQKYSAPRIMYSITVLSEHLLTAKWMASPNIAAEMAVVKLCSPKLGTDISALIARIEELENKIASGKLNLPSVTTAASIDGKTSKPEHIPNDSEITESAEKNVVSTTTNDNVDIGSRSSIAGSAEPWELWAEALSVIKSESKQLFAFLSPSKVARSGNEIIVSIQNEIAFERVNKPEGLNYLRDIFSRVQKTDLQVRINYKDRNASTKSETESNPLEDIIKLKDVLGDKMTIE